MNNFVGGHFGYFSSGKTHYILNGIVLLWGAPAKLVTLEEGNF